MTLPAQIAESTLLAGLVRLPEFLFTGLELVVYSTGVCPDV